MTIRRLGLRERLMQASILAGMAALGLPALAQAQPITGLYIGGGLGYNQLTSQSGSVDGLPGRFVQKSAPVSAGFKGGYGLIGSVGYGVGNGVRLEGEVNYRTNAQTGNVQTAGTSASSSGATTTSATGTEVKYGVMVNALFDIPLSRRWISPYVGIGFGYQLVNWSKMLFAANNIDYLSPTTVNPTGTIGQFAYQAIIGASFPIDAVPGLSATVEYRYQGAAGNRNYSATGYTQYISSSFKNNATKVHVSSDTNQTILLGFRYAFNPTGSLYAEPASPGSLAPYAAQAAVPAPAIPARTYIIFFDFDRADLTPRARDIVAEAVRASPSVPHTRLEVSGNTDSAGDAAYNQRLSLARAEAVAAELGRWGVPRDIIDIHGYGATRPLVPTAPGAREPQNRRVEIVYR